MGQSRPASNVHRRIEVWLASSQVDDVASLRLQLLRAQRAIMLGEGLIRLIRAESAIAALIGTLP